MHDEGYIHLDLKPANVFITFEGTLKIGDFGMAAKLPVPPSAEREGDREYIAPEILSRSLYDKPADVFSLGLMMLEIAANIILPDNGVHWQKLRSGDLSDAGRLSSGNLHHEMDETEDGLTSPRGPPTSHSMDRRFSHAPVWAPRFMIENTGALDKIVKWMLSPEPVDRPTVHQILNSEEAQWVDEHRKAGAVVYEGDYGPNPELSTNTAMGSHTDAMVTDEVVNWRRGV